MDLGVSAGELALLAAALVAAGLAAGFLSGLLGIGGGGVLVPVLYEVFRALDVDPAIRMHLALGTTLAVIVPTAFKSFAGHRARGSVDMQLLRRVAPFILVGCSRRGADRQGLERGHAQVGVGRRRRRSSPSRWRWAATTGGSATTCRRRRGRKPPPPWSPTSRP